MNVILLGAGGTAGHNFTLCLKMAGHTVIGLDSDALQLTAAEVDYRYHSPTEPSAKVALLKDITERHGAEMIHAQPDGEVMFLSNHADSFPGLLSLPSASALSIARDKNLTAERLERAGVPVPDRTTLNDYSGGLRWMRAIVGAGSRAALPVTTKEEAQFWAGYWFRKDRLKAEDFMLSEFLPGTEYAWQSVWRNGELVAAQGRIRREYLFGKLTPSGQTSTPSVAETVNHDGLNDIGERAVRALDASPNGIYGVDAKADAEGNIKVTEVNAGRFYSTSLFFASAGCNMPDLYVRRAEPLAKPMNPLPAGLLWVRAVDREPKLIAGASTLATHK